MFAKYITRLKLRRIAKRLQRQRALMKQELESESQSENGLPAVSVAEKVRSYIYGGDYEDGAWLK